MDVQLPDGRLLRGVPDGTTKSQLAEKLQKNGIQVPQEWMQPAAPPAPPPTPEPNLGAMNMPFMRNLRGGLGQAAEFTEKELTPTKMAAGLGETAGTMASSMVAEPLAGLGGMMMAKTAPVGAAVNKAADMMGMQAPSAADAVEGIRGAMTYQPRTAAGQMMTKAAAFPFEQYANKADEAGEWVRDKTGSEALATITSTGIQAAPMAIGAKGVKGVKSPTKPRADAPIIERIAGNTPQERAQNYVGSRTSLVWDRLSRDFQRRLEEVAATGSNLEKLDATAIDRQGLLASLDRPISNATRGQLTRDPPQQRTEQLLKATEKGAELKVRDLEQNAAILENLDILQGRTGGKATGDVATGQSVQGALRERLASEKANVKKLYEDAEKAGELEAPVNIDPLVEYLKNHDDPTQVGYAMTKLKALGAIKDEANGGISVSQNVPLTLKQLEGIRKAANAAGKNGGTPAHYAGELKAVIDKMTEGAGGDAYKAARSARKAVGDEFQRQGAVARLVEQRGMSHDRATALEDTWHKTVKEGSLEELKTVRASLEKSPRGQQAWADLKAATVDYIKNRSTGGKLGLKNETDASHVTWGAMKRAVDEIGPEKLREIFGADDAKKIETIVDAVQILKTEAPSGVKGSPTMDKLMTALDKIGKVPGLGRVAEGAKLIGKVKEIGKADRDLKRATTTPLDDR
jgi:hypothetical protein